jgi:hypothetical protein
VDRLPVCEAWFEAERRAEDLILITEAHTGSLIRANIFSCSGASATC